MAQWFAMKLSSFAIFILFLGSMEGAFGQNPPNLSTPAEANKEYKYKTRTDFVSDNDYAIYVRDNIYVGVMVRCCRSYELVHEGDIGKVMKLDRDGLHDLNIQANWQQKGGTYWVRYIHVQLLGMPAAVSNDSGTESSVTVEKGIRAVLRCPGFVPQPENRNEANASFKWYKARKGGGGSSIAKYIKSENLEESLLDLAGRATVDRTSGALVIPKTRVTDDHYYTCIFTNTASGRIWQDTKLTITVAPAPQDLRIFDSGPVEEGKSIMFVCRASEVKPLPQEIYFKFADDRSRLMTDFKNTTNADYLTSGVFACYTFTAYRTYQGKKLQCAYVTSTGKSITSFEAKEIKVLYQPTGAPMILANKESVPIDKTITMACDTKGVDGYISWYQWQFVNGSVIRNTTKSVFEYKATSAGRVKFICISGNRFGNTNKSEALEVEIQNEGKLDPNTTVVILGSLLGIFVCSTITLAICLIYTHLKYTGWRNTKQTSSDKSTTRDSHHYSEIELQRQPPAAAHPAPVAGNEAEEAQIYENC